MRIGQVIEPRLTAVAVPEPETVPSRKPDRTVVRPGAVRDLRNAAKEGRDTLGSLAYG